jgi:hypothetical protein
MEQTLLTRPPPPLRHRACRELLRAGLVEICGQESADKVELKLQEDGSVFGGAYIAAAASTWSGRGGQ